MTEHVLIENGQPWLHLIDLGLHGTTGAVGSFLISGNDELALLEVGPTTGRAALRAGVEAAGYRLEDVTRLIVTHIHLDHAGGAGTLMRELPNARLSVHPVGAPHLVDPTRLLASAGRIYGDLLEPLWGEIAGIEADRIDVFDDNQVLEVAGRRLRAFDTPGHASHHLAILDEGSGTLFTGDVGNVRLENSSWSNPTTPPPELNLDHWATSVERMQAIRAERLALTHFGFKDDVEEHLDAVLPSVVQLVDLAREVLMAGGNHEELTARISQNTASHLGVSVDDDIVRNAELANPPYMCAMGVERFLRKRGDLDTVTN